MVPYLEAALSGKTIHSQKIIDTTWGHIFTACYPVIASDGTNDILGALCIEIDMEDTYRSIEAINRSSFGIAAAASMIALLLIVISYFYTKKQKSRELTSSFWNRPQKQQRQPTRRNRPSCSICRMISGHR